MYKNKSFSIATIIFFILGLVCCTVCALKTRYKVEAIVYFAMFLLITVYSIFLYKKPHGNLLRWLFVAYAACMVPEVWFWTQVKQNPANMLIYVGIIGLVCYAAGRLDHIKSNAIIFVIVLGLLCYCTIGTFFIMQGTSKQFFNFFRPLSAFCLFFTLVGAYIARFKEHKKAGLVDKPEKVKGTVTE